MYQPVRVLLPCILVKLLLNFTVINLYRYPPISARECKGKGLNSAPYSQLSNDLKSGSISEFRYEDLDLGGSFDGEGGFGMGNLRGSESDLVGIGAVHSQWQLTRCVQNSYHPAIMNTRTHTPTDSPSK